MDTVADDLDEAAAAWRAAYARRIQKAKRHDARNHFLWRLSRLAPDLYRAIDRQEVAHLLRDKSGRPIFVRTKDGLKDRRGWTFPDYAPALAIDFVWTLKYPARIYGEDGDPWRDEPDFGVFDPRIESVDDAVSRMLPELQRRFRQTLEYMASIEDGIEAAPKYARLPVDRHFDWLIRYQLTGESMPGIAKTEGVNWRYVSRTIHRTADLIGLELRKRSPAGRPCKK